jgi:hypothetical protein
MLAVTQLVGFGAARRNPPVMRSRATYVAASSLSSHPVTLPAAVEPGDLLLLFGTNIGATDISSMAGWSPLFNDSSSQSRNVHLACFYRIADGSEGSTASVAMSAATSSFMALTFCIKDGKAPVAGTSAAGQGATSDPPAVASPAGAVPTLFLAVSQFTEAANNLSSYPSGYENGQWQNNTNGNSKMASAERTATLSSENPGVFTWSGSGSWIANTVAVAAA